MAGLAGVAAMTGELALALAIAAATVGAGSRMR